MSNVDCFFSFSEQQGNTVFVQLHEHNSWIGNVTQNKNDFKHNSINTFVPGHSITCTLAYAPRKNSNHPAHPHNLIKCADRLGPEVIFFSCTIRLSIKFFMLINLKLLTMPNSFFLAHLSQRLKVSYVITHHPSLSSSICPSVHNL